MRTRTVAAASGIGLGAALVARTTLRVPVLGEAGAPPALLTSLPSAWLVAVAVVLGALLGLAAERRGQSRLLTPFLLPGLALAALVPGAFRLAPFLAAFSGRTLDLLLAVALGLALWRSLGARGGEAPRFGGLVVAALGFAVYLGLGAKLQRDVGLSGDEPHYLLIAESLLRDGDLEVENNYREEHYRAFYGGKIGPHLASGSSYSVHGVGLALLLAPGYALFGLPGVLLVEALLASLLLREVFLLALASTSSRSAALFSAAAFGLTAPALFLSVSAYPELPAALIATAALRRVWEPRPHTSARALGWALWIGTLPFFHVKFLPLAAVLWGAMALRVRGGGRRPLGALVGGTFIALLALALFSQVTSGSPMPTASYGRQRIFAERIPVGVAGLLFDQEFGLLPVSPVYLVGIVGLASLGRRSPVALGVTLLAAAAVALPGAAHPLWSGGTSPPARFLYPALPLLAVASATAFAERPRRGLAVAAPALLVASLALGAVMVLLPGQLHLNARDGSGRIWEALSSSWDVTAYLPSLVTLDARSVATVLALLALLAGALWIQARGNVRVGARGLALFLLAAAWAQDWAGAKPSPRLEAGWASRAFHAIWERSGDRFVLLPSGLGLAAEGVLERVSLPLQAAPDDADPRHWGSRPYDLPAGRFTIEGVAPEGASGLNGSGCFSSGVTFRSRAGLEQFRLRARRLLAEPRLRMLEAAPTPFSAVHTVRFQDGALLHGLDDEAYLDRRGFWVRGGSSAAFALDTSRTCAAGCRLELDNGAVPNVLEVRWATGEARVPLAPGASRDVLIHDPSELARFEISSEAGFRPADVEPGNRDRRLLGVFLRAPATCGR